MVLVNTALSLRELPAPPEGKIGWPWTEQTEIFPDIETDGSKYPRISIVTPSYNQGRFIEETIRSVLLQGYPNLEYIIIDGGSTDNTVEIIKKYELFLSYWVTQKDRGQSHGINKGLDIATGDLLCWLNSDDYFLPNAFNNIVVNIPLKAYDSRLWVVSKGFEKLETQDNNLIPHPHTSKISQEDLAWKNTIIQPTVFWSKHLNYRLNESLNYVLDWDLWNQFIREIPPQIVDSYVAVSRVYDTTKTKTGKSKLADELYLTAKKYGRSPLRAFLYRFALWEPQYRGAGKAMSTTSFLFKVWRVLGRLVVRILLGKTALQQYSWDFCA
jgi:glycosyltransferase involved in cell wall biosynthesis